jgi:hypothetical protein
MPRIIAYQYDADQYCPPCTALAHGPEGGLRLSADEPELDEHGVRLYALDSEGNEVHPIFSTDDDWCGGGESGCTLECARCGRVVREHLPCDHGYCNCGDGCADGECDACGDLDDRYEDEDGYDRATGCTCDACEYAARWTPGCDECPDPDAEYPPVVPASAAPAERRCITCDRLLYEHEGPRCAECIEPLHAESAESDRAALELSEAIAVLQPADSLYPVQGEPDDAEVPAWRLLPPDLPTHGDRMGELCTCGATWGSHRGTVCPGTLRSWVWARTEHRRVTTPCFASHDGSPSAWPCVCTPCVRCGHREPTYATGLCARCAVLASEERHGRWADLRTQLRLPA